MMINRTIYLIRGELTNETYTHEELTAMPAEELYGLFIENGLIVPEHYQKMSGEKIAEYLKKDFEKLTLNDK